MTCCGFSDELVVVTKVSTALFAFDSDKAVATIVLVSCEETDVVGLVTSVLGRRNGSAMLSLLCCSELTLSSISLSLLLEESTVVAPSIDEARDASPGDAVEDIPVDLLLSFSFSLLSSVAPKMAGETTNTGDDDGKALFVGIKGPDPGFAEAMLIT